MNLLNRLIIKIIYLLSFIFLTMNGYSQQIPCPIIEQEDSRLQTVCDENIFDSNKINLSSHEDFQSYRSDCREFFARNPVRLDEIERVVVVRPLDLPNIAELISGRTVNQGGGRRFIEEDDVTGFPIGTLILFPEGTGNVHFEQTLQQRNKSAIYHRASSEADRINVTHAPGFVGALITATSGSFVIDGFNFTKSSGNENSDILSSQPMRSIIIKNSGFKKGGSNDQVGVLLRLNSSGSADISDMDVDCSSNSPRNFFCARVECFSFRGNCPDAMATVDGLKVTMSTDPQNDFTSINDPLHGLSLSGINQFAINDVRIAANNSPAPVSIQLNEFATNVVGCISNVIINSPTRAPKINIGGFAQASGTVGFFGNGFPDRCKQWCGGTADAQSVSPWYSGESHLYRSGYRLFPPTESKFYNRRLHIDVSDSRRSHYKSRQLC